MSKASKEPSSMSKRIANVEADIACCAQVDQLDTVPRLAHTVGHAAEIVA
jgi:phosphosulfolactate phosphohydrolase-like enzyme